MASETAVLILAHDNPVHVRRLLGALTGLDVFLHCDVGTPDSVLAAMTAGTRDVVMVPRHAHHRKRWGAIEAEHAGLRIVLEHSRAEHIVLLSGSCYPLVSVSDLQDELSGWRGLSRLELNPIPYAEWNRALSSDGGLHRFSRRFLSFDGQIVLLGDRPIPVGRRAIPPELRLHASSQWKIYARAHAETLLRVLSERPDLERFWRSTYVPEESCAATILASPDLSGSVAEELRYGPAWYIDWRSSLRGGHPRWLEVDDYPRILAARRQPSLQPDDPPSQGEVARRLFARKVGPGSDELLDRIDEELRSGATLARPEPTAPA